MLKLIARRLLAGIPILFIVSFFVFLLIDLVPGDPALILAGDNPTPEMVEQIRSDLHLDDPVPVRYGRWVVGAVHGDFGDSLVTKADVGKTIVGRLPISASLGILALLMSVVGGLLLGTWASLRPGGIVDRVVTFMCSLLIAIPSFWLALMLVLFLAVKRSLFPAIGYVAFSESPWEWLHHLLLPAFALSLAGIADTTLQLKASLSETLGRDFVLSARARGLSEWSVVFKHAFRSAAIPLVTLIGLRLGLLLGGTAVVESLFAIAGVGQLALGAAQSKDVNLLLGLVTMFTVGVLFFNALVDILCGYLNPKLRT